MDGRGTGPHAQAVASPLLDDLGVLQLQLLHRRQHHAVACLAGSGECGSHSVILPLSIGQLRQQLHQVAVITDGQTGTLRQRLVEQAAGQPHPCLRHAAAQVDPLYAGILHVLRRLQGCKMRRQLPDAAQLGGLRGHALVESAFDGVVSRQSVHPGRQEHVQFL